jgi:hypothetical protein
MGFHSPAGTRDISSSIKSGTALGSTQPPVKWVLGAVSPGVKWKSCEADYSPPSRAEVKNGGAIFSHPHTPLLHVATFIKPKDFFTF